jgi:hypothetical protein
MVLTYAVISVLNSLIVHGLSQYTAEYRSLSAQRLSESTVLLVDPNFLVADIEMTSVWKNTYKIVN